MRLAILGSGSSGNVALVEGGGARVLVDAGLAKSTIEERLAVQGVTLEQIDGVLVTHEHSDHVGCAASLNRPIYAPSATLRKKGIEGTRVLAGQAFRIASLTIHPVMLIHDAEETVGYVLTDGAYKVGILTDCGQPDLGIARAYAGCDVLVLEANHDLRMLAFGPYPPSIQRRVRARTGHLCNEQSAVMLRMILDAGPAPSLVIAAHISRKNNRVDLVQAALVPCLPKGTRLEIAAPDGCATQEVRNSRPRQLGLFDAQTTMNGAA